MEDGHTRNLDSGLDANFMLIFLKAKADISNVEKIVEQTKAKLNKPAL